MTRRLGADSLEDISGLRLRRFGNCGGCEERNDFG